MPEPDGISGSIDGRTITIQLPDPDQTIVPCVPAELAAEPVPAFVLEWILESDEIATIAQELLQAPTRSLCRAMQAPSGTVVGEFDPTGKLPRPIHRSPTPPPLRVGGLGFEVQGFSAARDDVPGLPTGVRLPGHLLDILLMARKVDAWITKGQRVCEWAYEKGAPDASWLPATS